MVGHNDNVAQVHGVLVVVIEVSVISVTVVWPLINNGYSYRIQHVLKAQSRNLKRTRRYRMTRGMTQTPCDN